MVEPISGNVLEKRSRRLRVVWIALSLIICLGSWAFWPIRRSAQVDVRFSHFDPVPGGQVAVFQVSNTGPSSVTLFGAQGRWPDWLILRLQGTKLDWSYSPGGDFGLSKPIVLSPGAKVAMPTFLPGLETWMVGVGYSTAPYSRFVPSRLRKVGRVESFLKARMRVALSEPISLSTEPTNIVPPLGLATNQIIVRWRPN
jgi:hypothetical protein